MSEKSVLFLTDPCDELAREFAVQTATYGQSFFCTAPDAVTDWCVAWVAGHALLQHLPSGESHFLGTDPQQAMRSACRLITEWDKLEAQEASLAVQ